MLHKLFLNTKGEGAKGYMVEGGSHKVETVFPKGATWEYKITGENRYTKADASAGMVKLNEEE